MIDSEEQDDGGDKLSVSALASSSAAFWQRMLKQRWERLQQEEAEAALEAKARSDGDDGDDASGVPPPAACTTQVLADRLLSLQHRCCVANGSWAML